MQYNQASENLNQHRLKRCYHRVISGLEKGGPLRLITLTSSPEAPPDIQRSFRKLIMRLQRRKLCRDYIKVIELTEAGNLHIHMCFRGEYIEQKYLSALWSEVHHSPIVDIRRVKTKSHDKRAVANYLAKYMSKEGCRRYSWSWGWVYKGFVRTWYLAKQIIRWNIPDTSESTAWIGLIRLWRSHVRSLSPPATFLTFLTQQIILLRKQANPLIPSPKIKLPQSAYSFPL